MPEGHNIHRTAQDHPRDFVGQRVRVSSPQGRFRDGSALLDGRKLIDVWAHGKHLFYNFPAKRMLRVHLGRYGRFRNWPLPAVANPGEQTHRTTPPLRTVDLMQIRLRLTQYIVASIAGFTLDDPTRA